MNCVHTVSSITTVKGGPFIVEPLFREVHTQFPISNIVTVLPCLSLINPMDDFICLVKVGVNMEKTQKKLFLASFEGYLAFEMLPFLNALS